MKPFKIPYRININFNRRNRAAHEFKFFQRECKHKVNNPSTLKNIAI